MKVLAALLLLAVAFPAFSEIFVVEKNTAWKPSPDIVFELGYEFAPGYPVGISFGSLGAYITGNFSPGPVTQNNPFEWTVGYSINIINDFLMIPIGAGARYDGEPAFIAEAGVKAIAYKFFYLSAKYRFIAFEEHSFSVGIGGILTKGFFE
jgi:hypothetical protein